MIKGSCLCGKIRFTIEGTPVKVSHCHCRMCQKQHGAAFATYARFRRDQVNYQSGTDNLATFNSSEDVLRKFCSNCGSNIEWGCSERFPQWVAIAVASFDTSFQVPDIIDLHEQSKACWLISES